MFLFAKYPKRVLASVAYDALAAAAAFFLALVLSYGRGLTLTQLPGPHISIIYTLAFCSIASVFAYSHRLHRAMWRYTSLMDCVQIVRIATLTTLCFLPFAFLTVRANLLPRSTPLVAWFLLIGFWALPRIGRRILIDNDAPWSLATQLTGLKLPHTAVDSIPIVVAGPVPRLESFVRELVRKSDAPYKAVGLLTDDRGSHGLFMHSVPVLGAASDLSAALIHLRGRGVRPQRLVIADDILDEKTLSSYLSLAAQNGLTLGRAPKMLDFDNATASKLVSPIALGDLLNRPQAVLDRIPVETLIHGKRVLVTGAGGSIGSELVRQISDLNPSMLAMLDNSEFNLYSIDKELGDRNPSLNRHEVLCDVRDRASLSSWFSQLRPDIVFHAAALKHVPLVESHPIEGIKTNVLGTQNVADLCVQFGVHRMVLVSTDKAVNPHNVMGATKRSAEAYCQALDAEGGATRFVAVRFGNVLGSAGSVVPLFQRQLAAGGPITVTHPDVTRYFMTIPEAVALVLQASTLGEGSPRGGVYVLDMGKPIKILDLARQMIQLSGKKPGADIKIEFVGLRPGEKMFEELVHDQEASVPTQCEGVMLVSPRTAALPILRNQLSKILTATELRDQDRALRLLSLIVPEFQIRQRRVGQEG
jgi:O-antigen biosynthesis protein WbqV